MLSQSENIEARIITEAQIPEMKDLARRALRLERCGNTITIMKEGAQIVELLTNYYGAINHHPITQFIAHRLKNVACPNPDALSFYSAKNQVEYLAEITNQENL